MTQQSDAVYRLEDLRWMADTGETPIGAAQRLGITVNALEKWLDRHDRVLWNRLQWNGRRHTGAAVLAARWPAAVS